MSAPVEAVGIRPVHHSFLAVEENDIYIIRVLYVRYHPRKFDQKSSGGAGVVSAHELDHGNSLRVVMTSDHDGFPGRAGKFENQVHHRERASGRLTGKRIQRELPS